MLRTADRTTMACPAHEELRTLSPLPDMSGIIALTRRGGWREALAQRIERHPAKACAGAGVQVAEIEARLG